MSIITDALKKAQKERFPGPPSLKKNIESGTDVSTQRPTTAAKALNWPMPYAITTAVLSLVIVAIYLTTLFHSALPKKTAVNERTAKSEAQKHAAPSKPATAPTVKIEPFSITIPRIVSPAAVPVKASLDLTGIMYLPTSPQAVINGSTVKEGDVVDGYTVMKIYPESVKLSSDGVDTELKLK